MLQILVRVFLTSKVIALALSSDRAKVSYARAWEILKALCLAFIALGGVCRELWDIAAEDLQEPLDVEFVEQGVGQRAIEFKVKALGMVAAAVSEAKAAVRGNEWIGRFRGAILQGRGFTNGWQTPVSSGDLEAAGSALRNVVSATSVSCDRAESALRGDRA